MANQPTTTEERQQEQPQRREVTRGGRQQGGLARRGGYYPAPVDVFRMSPFALLRRMSDDIDRIFGGLAGVPEAPVTRLWVPRIEVSQQEGKYLVRAELPGLKPEDVKVEASGDTLILQGERKCEIEDEGRTEIQYGRFYRAVPLPEGADIEHAQARFQNGVLEITVPISEERKNVREIPVQAAEAGEPGGTQAGQEGGTQAGQQGGTQKAA